MPRRVHLNSTQRKKLYDKLIKIRGRKCWVCGRNKGKIVVDDIFNDGDYKTQGRQQLLCYSCNSKKNPRGKGRFNPARSLTTDDVEPKLLRSEELEINKKAEPEFTSWLYFQVKQRGKLSVRDAKNAGAAYVSENSVRISQQTIGRYIDKLCSYEGKYVIEDGPEGEAVIRFRSQESPPPAPVDGAAIARQLTEKGGA